jgi:hypothetical protein
MGGFTLGFKTKETPKSSDPIIKSDMLVPRSLQQGMGPRKRSGPSYEIISLSPPQLLEDPRL